jgi:hypothetical protein
LANKSGGLLNAPLGLAHSKLMPLFHPAGQALNFDEELVIRHQFRFLLGLHQRVDDIL